MNYHIGRLFPSSLCVRAFGAAFGAAGIWWCSFCRLQPAKRTPPNISRNKSSNTQRTENKTTDMVIHQHSRRLLKMDILMSGTCWAHNKWNKMASDIKLVFHSSTSPAFVWIVSQVDPAHVLAVDFNVNFSITLPSTSKSCNWYYVIK